jgi:hypothetical protein
LEVGQASGHLAERLVFVQMPLSLNFDPTSIAHIARMLQPSKHVASHGAANGGATGAECDQSEITSHAQIVANARPSGLAC